MEKSNFAEFMKCMAEGVKDYTKDGNCSSCGQCCTAILAVSKTELKNIQRYVKKKRIQIEKHYGADFDITCPFRNNEKKICMIYEVRPDICRSFICNKSEKVIKKNRDSFENDGRYHFINLRDMFN